MPRKPKQDISSFGASRLKPPKFHVGAAWIRPIFALDSLTRLCGSLVTPHEPESGVYREICPERRTQSNNVFGAFRAIAYPHTTNS